VGKIGRDELLAAESAAYHAPGTCTFYGTANTNQMLMEFMGLQLPGGSFVNPGTPLRDQLTAEAVTTALATTNLGDDYSPLAKVIDEKSIVNGIAGLLATGGSTNHTIHLVAIAAAAGIKIDWQDFSDLSTVIPQLSRVYPNGTADVNHFHAAGGLGFIMSDMLANELLHDDVSTILGPGLKNFCREPHIDGDTLVWKDTQELSLDEDILRPCANPFSAEGGLQLVSGNLGRAMVSEGLEQDARLVLLDLRFDDDLAELPADRVSLRELNMFDEQATRACFDHIGPVDVLCNAAGGFAMGTAVHETGDADWSGMFDINVRTLLNGVRAVVPGMRERGRGRIVNVGAAGALAGAALMAPYQVAKMAVIRITECLDEELKSDGINVNCVMPSVIDTPQNREAMPDADFKQWVTPAQLASTICFLASDAASGIHGAAVPVKNLA